MKQKPLKSLPVDQLVPAPFNDNEHPEEQLAHLEESIRTFGQPVPVIIREQDNMILAGHAIWMSVKALGHKQIEVRPVECTEDEAKAFLIAANRLGRLSKQNEAQTATLLSEIPADFHFAIGYSEAEVAALLEALDEKALEILEVETDDVADRFWINVTGPLANQAETLDRLKEVLNDIEGVNVEIGTFMA